MLEPWKGVYRGISFKTEIVPVDARIAGVGEKVTK